MDKDFQDRIDEYLLRGNTMSEEDKEQFLKEIEEDAEKKEQYELTKNIRVAIVSRGEKLKAMAEFQKETEEAEKAEEVAATGHKTDFRKKLLWFSSIAAILVVGFFAINPLLFDHSQNGSVRGSDDDVFEIAAPNDSCDNDTTVVDTINFHPHG